MTRIDPITSASVTYGPPPVEDDDGIGVDVAQTFLRTNGFIWNTELFGDLLAGHINSTDDDVTLFSPVRIVDADSRPTIDVSGENITMTAGTLGGLGGIGERDTSSRSTSTPCRTIPPARASSVR